MRLLQMDRIFVSIGKRGGNPDSAIEGFAASRTLLILEGHLLVGMTKKWDNLLTEVTFCCRQSSEREKFVFFLFLLYAAWVRSLAERPSVSYTKVVMEVAWTGHNLQYTKTN